MLLGGVTYISSSGIVAKLVADLDRIGNHETSVILSILVIEDLAMVLYLPIVSGVLFGGSLLSTTVTVCVSLLVVVGVLGAGLLLWRPAERSCFEPIQRSAVVDPARRHAALCWDRRTPSTYLRQWGRSSWESHCRATSSPMPAACFCRCETSSAAVFFVFFGLQVDLGLIPDVAVAAVVIAAVTIATKFATGWIAAGRVAIGKPGRARAGAALIAHGEFSIVIAELGISRESDLGALAATYVIILTLVGAVPLPVFRLNNPPHPKRVVPAPGGSGSLALRSGFASAAGRQRARTSLH